MIAELSPLDLLKSADSQVLACYCQVVADHAAAVATLAAEGRVVANPTTGHQHPHPAVADAQLRGPKSFNLPGNSVSPRQASSGWLRCRPTTTTRSTRLPRRMTGENETGRATIDLVSSVSADAGQSPRGGWNPDSGRHAP
ncbi:P27 family phage terminase small subunit [Mycobacterium shinjukuense]|uniref:P27 family phage terminase small subunit n=1 Tax=Mycobacterium shinjukuense TaxID=398694 RepID=UPI001E308F63|nr:P27 family phage terminase small subunit [Mycobacterium shinjukuense]